jgi:hypothetical protein
MSEISPRPEVTSLHIRGLIPVSVLDAFYADCAWVNRSAASRRHPSATSQSKCLSAYKNGFENSASNYLFALSVSQYYELTDG